MGSPLERLVHGGRQGDDCAERTAVLRLANPVGVEVDVLVVWIHCGERPHAISEVATTVKRMAARDPGTSSGGGECELTRPTGRCLVDGDAVGAALRTLARPSDATQGSASVTPSPIPAKQGLMTRVGDVALQGAAIPTASWSVIAQRRFSL